jgi:hypothetical protein
VLVLPPLLGHLPDCLETLRSRGLAPEHAIELGACWREPLSPLLPAACRSLFASHACRIAPHLAHESARKWIQC